MQITAQSKKEEEEKKANKTLMVDAELFKKKKKSLMGSLFKVTQTIKHNIFTCI